MQSYNDHDNPRITAPTRHVTPLARAVFAAVLATAAPAQASSVSYFQDQSNHQHSGIEYPDGTDFLKVAFNDEDTDNPSHFQDILHSRISHGFSETEHGLTGHSLTEKQWGDQDSPLSPRSKNDNDNDHNHGNDLYTLLHEGRDDDFVLRKYGRRHDEHDIWERGEHCDLPGPTPQPSVVPLPPAAWLFGSGLLGLIAIARRKTRA